MHKISPLCFQVFGCRVNIYDSRDICSTHSFIHSHILQLFIKYLWRSRRRASYWVYRSEQSSYGLCLHGEYSRGKKTVPYHSTYMQTLIQMELVGSSLSSLSLCLPFFFLFLPSPPPPPFLSVSNPWDSKNSQCSTDLVSLSLLNNVNLEIRDNKVLGPAMFLCDR